jgi:hypothetical protein
MLIFGYKPISGLLFTRFLNYETASEEGKDERLKAYE